MCSRTPFFGLELLYDCLSAVGRPIEYEKIHHMNSWRTVVVKWAKQNYTCMYMCVHMCVCTCAYSVEFTVDCRVKRVKPGHNSDVIISTMAFQITSVPMVCSIVCSGADQRNHQSSASLAFVKGIDRWPVNSPHKGSVTKENVSIWWRHRGIWLEAEWRTEKSITNWICCHLICSETNSAVADKGK